MNIQEVASKHGATVLNQSEVSLNDEVVHPVIIVADDNSLHVGIQIKDLEKLEDSAVVVEKEYVEELIERIRDCYIKIRVIEQDLNK